MVSLSFQWVKGLNHSMKKYEAMIKYATKKINKTLDKVEYPSGISGFYVKLPHGCGVKIYNAHDDYNMSRRDVELSEDWYTAEMAMKAMNRVHRVGAAPKAYCVAPLKIRGYWHVGLFMQHASGYHPPCKNYAYDHNFGVDVHIARYVRKKLCKAGVVHTDLGSHNIKINKKGKVSILDFDHTELKRLPKK